MQGQRSQGTATSGSSRSSGSGRFMPYACNSYGQVGYRKRECPLRRQQTFLVEEGQQGIHFGSVS